MDIGSKCPKCGGTKRIKDKNGTISPCWECLNRGDLDQHDKKLKDPGMKI